ncbi:RuvA C-terminal domain-containing protein [Vibrio sp. Of14-4]|uniref:RuvA C-terminal domain-containing protein n=1 Tax=Vibrio sp. Of14-4 TaxID=2724878 RepID=UPI001EF162FC|nr:RuvA C-terminal domain-containing protein [Vibrio sp. Of14-4]
MVTGGMMSAIEKPDPSTHYVIVYFDGSHMASLEVDAKSRAEAIEALKNLGFTERDMFSISP